MMYPTNVPARTTILLLATVLREASTSFIWYVSVIWFLKSRAAYQDRGHLKYLVSVLDKGVILAKDICIIMPTIREFQSLKAYYANARQHGFDVSRIHTLIMTEDFCDKQAMLKMFADEGVSGEVFNEVDRRAWLKEHGLESLGDVIPRKTHAEISTGLLYMWVHKNFKYGVFIDDDTVPFPQHDYFGTHVANLEYKGPIKAVSSDKKWVNTLHQNFSRHKLYPRGYPYSAMKEVVSVRDGTATNVVLSQGLWTNIPDLDSIRILMDGDLNGQAKTLTHETDFKGNFIPDKGNYITSCTMNLAFKREIIPIF